MRSDELETVQDGAHLLRTLALACSPRSRCWPLRARDLPRPRAGGARRCARSGFAFVDRRHRWSCSPTRSRGAPSSARSADTASAEPAVQRPWDIGTLAAPRDRPGDRRLRDRDHPRRVARGPELVGDLGPPRDHALLPPAADRLRRARGPAAADLLVGPRRGATHRLGPLAAADPLHRARLRVPAPPGDPRVPRRRRDRVAGRDGVADGARGCARRASVAPASRRAAARRARVDELERLAGLHDSGVLDDEEFAAEKTRVLSS